MIEKNWWVKKLVSEVIKKNNFYHYSCEEIFDFNHYPSTIFYQSNKIFELQVLFYYYLQLILTAPFFSNHQISLASLLKLGYQ